MSRKQITHLTKIAIVFTINMYHAQAATFTVSNTNDTGAGSLRKAIEDANLTVAADTINFSIPGAGPHTITPATPLPKLTAMATINGYLQTGASVNTLASGDNAVLQILVRDRLVVDSTNCVVRGLAVDAIQVGALSGPNGNNVIEGNFIGLDTTGTNSLGDTGSGLFVQTPNNRIGGTTPAARNIISGHGTTGMEIFGDFGFGNLVQGNFIGTDRTGTISIPNTDRALVVNQMASSATIGGTTAGARNVISGNLNRGITLDGNNNIVQGNIIGADVTGLNPLGNARTGVEVGGNSNNASDSFATIGGGIANAASSGSTVVGGGAFNIASNSFATVPGGRFNVAGGQSSLAAGQRAKAIHEGSFVWGDRTEADISSTASNQFVVRARGGIEVDPLTRMSFGFQTRQMINLWGTIYGIGIQAGTMYFRTDDFPGAQTFAWYRGGTHNDAQLNAGGGTEMMRLVPGGLFVNGALVLTSDRDAKENFTAVDTREVLTKVAALPIQQWNYKADTATPHIGPVAQDFHAAFGVGPDDKHIATVDADGVALAAIQGLYEMQKDEGGRMKEDVERMRDEMQKLKAENADLKAQLAELKATVRAVSERIRDLEHAPQLVTLTPQLRGKGLLRMAEPVPATPND